MTAQRRVGIFGGTFDPVHSGHIESARQLVAALALDTLHFMPCKQHPHHKQPGATGEQRLDMLAIAIGGMDKEHSHAIAIDDREFHREGMSYTVDSLTDIRAEQGQDTVLATVMGSDAFASLTRWYRWEQLLSLSNICVIERAGQIPLAEISEPALQHLLASQVSELTMPAGQLVTLSLQPYLVSSTDIRQAFALQSKADGRVHKGIEAKVKSFLSADVIDYIVDQQLYTANQSMR